MYTCLYFIILPFILLCAFAEDQLVFVNVLYRHGDRTPVDPYPTDPYRNASFWPTQFGHLTNTGKQQHFELGKWLRKRYSSFLPEKYSLNDIFVRSTDVDRTLMSAEANLAGLYTPTDSDIWNPDIKWQPIPVHTVPESWDAVLSAKKPCPRYSVEIKKLFNTPEFKNISSKLTPLFKYVSEHSGRKMYDIQQLGYLYNTLFIEDLYKFQLPNWTRKIYPDELLPWASLSFETNCYTPILQRLKIGLFLNEVFTRFVNKTKDHLSPDRKMWMYSAHDTNIANVLMAFDAFKSHPHCPSYTSTIILELWKTNLSEYYVSAFYKNDSTAHPISILGCNHQCPLDSVLKRLKPILITPKEWEMECDSITAPFVSTIAAIAVVFCGLLLLLLLMSLCIGAVYSDRHQRRRNQLYQPLSDDIN